MPQGSFYSRLGPNSFPTISWCTFGTGILGIFLVISGAILTGIAFTEITPPDYDENYNRYLGSNIMRIIGPLLMIFGGILLFGSCGLFAYAFYVVNRSEAESDGVEWGRGAQANKRSAGQTRAHLSGFSPQFKTSIKREYSVSDYTDADVEDTDGTEQRAIN